MTLLFEVRRMDPLQPPVLTAEVYMATGQTDKDKQPRGTHCTNNDTRQYFHVSWC